MDFFLRCLCVIAPVDLDLQANVRCVRGFAFTDLERFRRVIGSRENIGLFVVRRHEFLVKLRCQKPPAELQILKRRMHIVAKMERIKLFYSIAGLGALRRFKARQTARRKKKKIIATEDTEKSEKNNLNISR